MAMMSNYLHKNGCILLHTGLSQARGTKFKSTVRRMCLRNENIPVDRKLVVGNLPWSCDSEALAKVLQNVGIVEHVQEVEVICDRETGRSRGFGYVTFTTNELAQAALEKIDGHVVQGRQLKVSFSEAQKRSSSSSAEHTRIFVGNLPWGVDNGSLEEFFKSHGTVIEARIIYDRDTGRSRGFGFVTLSSQKEAQDAIHSLNGADCDGRQLRVKLAVQFN